MQISIVVLHIANTKIVGSDHGAHEVEPLVNCACMSGAAIGSAFAGHRGRGARGRGSSRGRGSPGRGSSRGRHRDIVTPRILATTEEGSAADQSQLPARRPSSHSLEPITSRMPPAGRWLFCEAEGVQPAGSATGSGLPLKSRRYSASPGGGISQGTLGAPKSARTEAGGRASSRQRFRRSARRAPQTRGNGGSFRLRDDGNVR